MLPRSQDTDNDLKVASLTADDVDEILVLYGLAKSVSPHGFMADRNKEEYLQLFANGAIGVGLRNANRLVAYGIAHRLDRNPYAEVRLLSDIDPARELVYHGHGWTVHPEYQRRGIGQQLFKIRFQRLSEMKVAHFFGLAAVDNLSSVAGVLQSDAVVVGFAADETAMNYVVYWGHLCTRLNSKLPPIVVASGNREEQERLFASRHSATRLIRQSPRNEHDRAGEWSFEFVPCI